jgi:hypothetical protein
MGTAFQSYGIFWRRLFFTLITACIIAAIVIQDHTDYLPLGLFNTGSDTLHRIADGCLAAAGLALIFQLIELFTGRLRWAGGIVRGVYVSIVILEVLLIFSDQLFVTGDPNGRLGQYCEVAHSGHPPVILKKNFARHRTILPCFADSDSADAGPRVLFLGDSYTEGSGRSTDCNYPDVVQRVLREKWMSNVRVVNAGVSGYGPVEALGLLRWYLSNGCRAQAIVYNLTLQNDFADNLPGTERRVVAGIIFRFPQSWFLRTFHPLNTRTFRWALVLTFFGKASTHDMLQAVSVAGGPCDMHPQPLTQVSPFLRDTVERDYDNVRRVASSSVGYVEATAAIARMREIASEMHVPFVLVVFPDRVLVDAELQALMDTEAPDASSQLHAYATQLAADRVLDMYGQLAGRSGMYRDVDTHLSDLGNVVAGEYVGTALVEELSRIRSAER